MSLKKAIKAERKNMVEGWSNIETALKEMLNLQKRPTKAHYMKLHSLMFNFYKTCTPKSISTLQNNSNILAVPRNYSISFLNEPLRLAVQKYLMEHLKQKYMCISSMNNEYEFLVAFTRENDHFKDYSTKLRNLCNCLNGLNNPKDDNSIWEVWKSSFALLLIPRVTSTVLKFIEKNRQGQFNDTMFLKRVINCFIDLGAFERDELAIYKDKFETAFLQLTKEYYENQMRTIVNIECVYFLTKSLDEEEMIRGVYVHESTLSLIQLICVEIIVEPYRNFICDEIVALMTGHTLSGRYPSTGQKDFILNAYCRIMRHDVEHTKLLQQLKNHIVSEGQRKLVNCTSPAFYMKAITTIYEQFQIFSKDISYSIMLEQVCREFVNSENNFSNVQGKKQWLAIFCNDVIPFGKSMLNSCMDMILFTFKLINDKNSFESDYINLLNVRLSVANNCDFEVETTLLYTLIRSSEEQQLHIGTLNRMIDAYRNLISKKNNLQDISTSRC